MGEHKHSEYKRWSKENWEERCSQNAPNRRRKRGLFGLMVVLFGTWWLLRRMDIEIVPTWMMTWPVLLMAVGFVSLIGNGFRKAGGYIMVLVGAVFFARNHFDIPINIEPYFWPALVILIGLIILFKPSSHHRWKKKRWSTESGDHDNEYHSHTDDSDSLDALVICGGVHKDIISKTFKGGEATCIMGGAELHFSKADISSRATIDVTIVMGGVKIVVPQNWNVVVNTSNILGGVDDKRKSEYAPIEGETKTLVLTGTVVMGGIDIQSY